MGGRTEARRTMLRARAMMAAGAATALVAWGSVARETARAASADLRAATLVVAAAIGGTAVASALLGAGAVAGRIALGIEGSLRTRANLWTIRAALAAAVAGVSLLVFLGRT